MGKTCNEIRQLIIMKRIQVAPVRKIGNELNLAHSTVQHICNRFLTTNTISDLPKSGRPPKKEGSSAAF